MEKEDQKPIIPPTLTLQVVFDDGRIKALLAHADGSWKIEVFSSEDHMRAFAKENGYEVREGEEYQ